MSRGGSIDWLCVPQPDSPSLFAGLLDSERGGRFRIAPRDVRSVSRRYLGRSLVLETTFECAGGRARLVDLFHVAPQAARHAELRPDQELARRIECVEGEVEVEVEVDPRPDYGRRPARFRDDGRPGFSVRAGPRSFLLASELPLSVRDGGRVGGRERLRAGDRRWLALSHTRHGPGVYPATGEPAEARLRESLGWWERWTGGCRLPALAREETARSAAVLKSLVYPPSGAVVAAPTTSLPEKIGGDANWDYRYCWIRDASLVMRAMLNLGVHDEAHSFFSWLLYATRLTWPRLQVLYDVHGRTSVKERELASLGGYRGSRPVRIGNAAIGQRQLDVYGALLDAAWQYHEAGGELSRAAGRMLTGFVERARDQWRQPDAGIWESRSAPSHHTLSKAMCWVAMERGRRFVGEGIVRTDRERLAREMRAAGRAVREDGWSESRRSYVATLGGDELDASLLLLSIYGFEPADSDRMNATIDRVYGELGAGGGLLRRRADGSAFGVCGFWGVEALARAGRRERARDAFDSLLASSNDVGLYSEETDPESGAFLGNFPQALTHIGAVNAACRLDPDHAPRRPPRAERKVG